MDNDEENGVYTLTIKNPKMEDGGRYTCIVRECNDLSCKGYLEVERELLASKKILAEFLHVFFQLPILSMELPRACRTKRGKREGRST